MLYLLEKFLLPLQCDKSLIFMKKKICILLLIVVCLFSCQNSGKIDYEHIIQNAYKAKLFRTLQR